MNWLNIHTDTLRSEEYLGAEPVERATWLNLMAWCVSQENGGVILGASDWGERKWMQVCGITKQEATLVSKLFKIGSDGAMVVSLYPLDKEDEVKAKREVARENGKKGGRPPNKPTSVPEITDVAKRKGKRREGKEKENDDADLLKRKSKARASSQNEVEEFAKSIGLKATDGYAFFNSREGNGWKIGGNAIKDWKATMRSWKAAGHHPSQKNGETAKAPKCRL